MRGMPGGDMREIKFRAWIKKSKDMMYGWNISSNRFGEFDVGWFGNLGELPDDNECTWDQYLYTEVILMQYTGLKDKNGKEIYEGDIIQWWNDAGPPQEVKATRGGWYPFIEDMTTGKSYRYKIIGNIYENPEAL